MPRTASQPFDRTLLSRVIELGDGAPSPDERLQIMRLVRGHSTDLAAELDEVLVRQMLRLHGGIESARQSQRELKGLLDNLTAPPWHPAVFLREGAPNGGPTAVVALGSSRRVVHVGPGVSPTFLSAGEEVLLSHDLNLLVARSLDGAVRGGDVAAFDRRTADGRLVVKARDEEVIVESAATLTTMPLKSGDLVRWDRTVGMAFEVIERAAGDTLFLEETPSETFADIGGLDAQIAELERAVLMPFHHRDLVARYGLPPKKSVLLWGPPGTGKTMMARALANRVSERSSAARARFMNIKPGALHSKWYAQSEQNYRDAFRIAREAGEREPGIPVVMFFDEVDAVGSSRGASVTRVDDRVLTAFMTELQGLEGRGNVMVVAATNRRDALDPALVRPGRLGDCVIHVPSPGRKASRAILAKHLPPSIPYAQSGHGPSAAAVRDEILDAAVARLFAPNADSDVAEIVFRDGRRRVVKACDLVSGALLAKVASDATERACVRELEGGSAGLCLGDMVAALECEVESAGQLLTPANCRAYLTNLPQDVDVVSVSAVGRAVRRSDRYVTQHPTAAVRREPQACAGESEPCCQN